MVRSSSAWPPNGTKKKSTRSVSTLTPSQLERKRANDREGQRAYRDRIKAQIEHLEQEVKMRDQTVQNLLRHNRALQDEVSWLKENMGVSMTSSPYSTPVDDNSFSTGSVAIPSPKASPFPSGDYGSLPDYSQQYVPLPNNGESWTNTVPVLPNVSSPSSSANTDDYGAGYIPTSVPASMLPSNNASISSISAVGGRKDIKMVYKDVDSHDTAFHLANQSIQGAPNPYMQQQQHQQQQQQQPAWNMYPAVCYPQAQSSVH